MSDVLKVRAVLKSRKPVFRRQDHYRKARLDESWRRPKGVDSKLRKRKKGAGAWVQPGYGSPVSVRGADSFGTFPVLVSDAKVVSSLDSKRHSIVIASGVGGLGRKRIIEAALGRKILVLNVKHVDKFSERLSVEMSERKSRRKDILLRRKVKISAPEKKPAEKSEKPVSGEDKAAQEKAEKDKVLTMRDV